MEPDYSLNSKEEYNRACETVSDIIQCLYTSCGVNRYSDCIATHTFPSDSAYSAPIPHGIIAFGSDQSICLGLPTNTVLANKPTVGLSVIRVLRGHTSSIRCLRWVNSNAHSTGRDWDNHLLLISADSTGKVICWACHVTTILQHIDATFCGYPAKAGGNWYRLFEFQLPAGSCSPNSIDASLVYRNLNQYIQLAIDVAVGHAVFSRLITFKQGKPCPADGNIDANRLPYLYPADDAEVFSTIDRKPSLCLCLRTLVLGGTDTHDSLHFVLLGLENGCTEIWCQHLIVPGHAEGDLVAPASEFILSAKLAGHTDWVRCLDWCPVAEGDTGTSFLIASGGQDHIIRLWRMYHIDRKDQGDSHPVDAEMSIDTLLLPRSANPKVCSLAIVAESVLAGHDNWVTAVAWAPRQATDRWVPRLLSASMDKSLIIWSPTSSISTSADSSSVCTEVTTIASTAAAGSYGLWLESARLGYLNDTGLGFIGCAWLPSDATAVYGLHFQGGLSVWSASTDGTGLWIPGSSLSGHVGPLTDLSWTVSDSASSLLFTTGVDQTVRTHVPLVKCAANREACGKQTVAQSHWMEIARPQVHGYDMTAIATLSPISYVSASDEKVIRVFSATRSFITSFEELSGQKMNISDQVAASLAVGAVQPSLGLSNQVVATNSVDSECNGTSSKREVAFGPGVSPQSSLTEDYLQYSTLWPETKKLYGHAYEVFCLAAHPKLQLVASACVSAQQQHACIILWSGQSNWNVHQRLVHHKLTVTQLSFCEDGSQLLAVSRDRTWSRWAIATQSDDIGAKGSPAVYRLAAYPMKGSGHSRIIWTSSWSPDDKYFFTGSRDKTVLLWPTSPSDTPSPIACSPVSVVATLPHAVTALSVCALSDDHCLLAVGLESGQLRLLVLQPNYQMGCTICLPPAWCHGPDRRVRQLAFDQRRPPQKVPNSDWLSPGNTVYLASGGDDGLLRVLQLDVDKLLRRAQLMDTP